MPFVIEPVIVPEGVRGQFGQCRQVEGGIVQDGLTHDSASVKVEVSLGQGFAHVTASSERGDPDDQGAVDSASLGC
ncbi:hypothetical protein CCR95_20535 [Thiocystis minor]|nr:hypothetical protein [Thiocystis minor]